LTFPSRIQVLHRSGDVLDRHLGVDPVLIEEIDDVGLQALERGLSDLLDVLGPAVQTGLLLVGVDLEPELGGDDDPSADRSERFADELLIRERAIHLGRVEERLAALHRSRRGRSSPSCRQADHRKAHPHAAEPNRRDSRPLLPNLRFCIVRSFHLPVTEQLGNESRARRLR